MKLFKPKFWAKDHLTTFSLLLLPLSFIVKLLFLLKITITTKTKFDLPIICVGNIYIGGTGKTPLSIKIFEIISRLKRKPVIIKKFYKDHLDEINLIENKTKNIITNRSRKKAILYGINKNFDTIILDDGFQDYSIKKNLNILCFNEKQLIGNGYTIPSGPLRQSLSSIEKCQIILFNGKKNKNFESKIKKINKNIAFFYFKYEPINITKFKNKNFLAFAGIGNPDNFFSLLYKHKIKVKKKISFPDHYQFSKKDLDNLVSEAKKNNLKLITTEKDFFRFKKLKFKNINYLAIKLKLYNEKNFTNHLKKYLP